MKKMPLGDRGMLDVYTEEEYIRRTEVNPKAAELLISTSTGIIKDGYVYPLVSTKNNSAVVCAKDYGQFIKYKKPVSDKDKKEYSESRVLNFDTNAAGVKKMIQTTAEIEASERKMLLMADNITHYNIKDDDSPEFALLKQAINEKHIDMASYRHRHGDDYSNNMRLLATSNNITFGKLRTIANVCDIEVELVMKDKEGCLHPMGKELRKVIT